MGDNIAGLGKAANRVSARIIIGLAVLAIVLIVATVWWQVARLAAIDSFDKCAEQYPVMDSYPQQCRTPDGRLFVDDVEK